MHYCLYCVCTLPSFLTAPIYSFFEMLVDAHCHPTDHPELEGLAGKSDMKMCIMSTRLDDIDLVADWGVKFSEQMTPAFGLHPWYSHWLCINDSFTKYQHYQSILDPAPQNEEDVADLPDPISIEEYLSKVRHLLNKFPNALLGEVGLDKPFKLKHKGQLLPYRVKMDHQRAVLRAQLAIADELHRSVSLHGVQAAQPLYEDVKQFSNLRAACLHSYGGSPEFYRDSWCKLKIPIYVSIAILINGRIPPPKMVKLLDVLKPEYVLTESDVNKLGEFQEDMVKQSLALFGNHFRWNEPEKVIEHNYSRFLG